MKKTGLKKSARLPGYVHFRMGIHMLTGAGRLSDISRGYLII